MADTQRRAKRDSQRPEGVSAIKDRAPHSMTIFTERTESRRTAFALTSLRISCADSGYREAGRASARQLDALVRCARRPVRLLGRVFRM